MLSYGDHDRRMVSRGIDGRELVNALRKAVGDIDSHVALRVRGCVDALEERKLSRVRDSR